MAIKASIAPIKTVITGALITGALMTGAITGSVIMRMVIIRSGTITPVITILITVVTMDVGIGRSLPPINEDSD